jgi:hypothetical protein
MSKLHDKYDNSSPSDKRKTRGRERVKDKIASDGYDWYAVLGFTEKDPKERAKISSDKISRAFTKQLTKYHPDRVGNVSPEESKQFNAMFRLVQQAGMVLTNKTKRSAYDIEQSVQESSGFNNHKSKFEEFKDLQERNITDDTKQRAKLDFEKGLAELNKKHGADKYSVKAIGKDDANRKMEDLIYQRQIEQDELKPTKIFTDGEEFDRDRFMKAFAKDQYKRSKKNGTGDGVIPYGQIGAFNDMTQTFGINDDYGSLYKEDKFGGDNKFGKFNNSGSDSDSDSDNSIDSCEIDTDYMNKYTKSGKTDNSDVQTALEKLMKDREKENDEYENMDISSFKSAMNDTFGISKSMGFMVGNRAGGDQLQRKLKKQLANNEVDAYMKMIGYEESSSSDGDSYEIDS